MSHVRNLFHPAPGQQQSPSLAAATATVPDPIGSIEPVAQVVTGIDSPPEFLVEEARFTPAARLAYYDDPRGAAADRYRLLRMRLKDSARTGKLKKILVTGPQANEGKSTVTLNLATALAERGKRRVLVVEADLHHSSISQTLRLKPWVGLTECLVDTTINPLSSIRRIEPLGWYFLPAGEPRNNPTELLQAPAFGQVMQKLPLHFDWILIDSPPVIPITDSLSIQQHTDASLLVVRAGRTSREAVDHAVELLGKKNILGVVLNAVETRNRLYYPYYDGNRREQED